MTDVTAGRLGGRTGTVVVRQVADALRRDSHVLADQIARHISENVPELEQHGVEELVLENCRANTTILLDYLSRGVPLGSFAPSNEVVQQTQALAQSGVSLTAIDRAYRVGTQYMIGLWSDAVGGYGPDNRSSVEAVKVGSLYLLGWLDLILERLSEEYRRELERLARERGLARAETVRRLLDDPDADPVAAGFRLGYRVTGSHVAVVLRDRSPAPDGSALDLALGEIERLLGTGKALAVRVDVRTTWCWLPAPPLDANALTLISGPVLAAIGRPAKGLDGFRRSHRQAVDALRVAETAARPPGGVTYYDDVEIAAMCSLDPDRARDFVRTELGRLAGADRTSRSQRRTLGAFFAANSNYRATGKALGIHHNTVRYRLEQAERALGHAVGERRLAVELALHIATLIDVSDEVDESGEPR